MFDKPLFPETQVSIVFEGTIRTPPDRFIDNPEDHFKYPQDFRVELVDNHNGYTYTVKVVDVRGISREENGEVAVTYGKPTGQLPETRTQVLPAGFMMQSLST